MKAILTVFYKFIVGLLYIGIPFCVLAGLAMLIAYSPSAVVICRIGILITMTPVILFGIYKLGDVLLNKEPDNE